MKSFRQGVLLLTLLATAISAEDQLAFVYQLVRHGARASLNKYQPFPFQGPAGSLTPSGMRQRYLLGTFNRQRMIDSYGMLDDTFNPNQVYTQSTDVPRVIQSTQAELMGLYPQQTSTTSKGQEASSKSMPPMKTLRATIDGLTLVPVYSYMPPSMRDDLNAQGCNYVSQCIQTQYSDPKNFIQEGYYALPMVGYRLAQAYNWAKADVANMNYLQFQQLSDVVMAENFQGAPKRGNFTEEDWNIIRNSQKVAAYRSLDKYGLRLFMSRYFQKPLQAMVDKVATLLNGTETRDSLRYYLHSAHDTQVVDALLVLQPYMYDFIDGPFASTLYFELHYDDACLSTTKNTSCFTVEVYNNGIPLRFDTCLTANQASGSTSPVCQYDDFMTHINKRRFQGDLGQLCQQGYNPYPQHQQE